MTVVRPEDDADRDAVRAVLTAAFGGAYPTRRGDLHGSVQRGLRGAMTVAGDAPPTRLAAVIFMAGCSGDCVGLRP